RPGPARAAVHRAGGAAVPRSIASSTTASAWPKLFQFDYQLEMYKPVAKRRWGYFALPVLHGDRLVGKLDATADRKAGVLRVSAIHEDVKFTGAMRKAVQGELADLAAWLGLAVEAR